MKRIKGTIVNKTPHVLNVHVDGDVVAIAPTLPTPRVSTKRVEIAEINGIPVDEVEYGEVLNLPEPKRNVFLVVSLLVAEACEDRDDLLVVGEPIRDDAGKIVGCRGLSVPR